MKRFFFLIILMLGVGTAFAATTAGKTGLLKPGSRMPGFSLPDVVSGKTVSDSDFKSKKAMMMVFMCRHCPYVQHVKKALAQIGKDYAARDLALVGISANDPAAYPEDAPASLKAMALETGFSFPVLFDGSQQVAKAFTAIATPDVFIFDKDRKLVYRGEFDDTRPHSGKDATGKEVREALDAALSGRQVPVNQKPAMGCSIKWKPGNTPVYSR
jgi:peroxiredoxin